MLHHEGLVDRAAHIHQREADVIRGGADPKDGRETKQDEEGDRKCLRDDHELDFANAVCKRRRDEQADAHCQRTPREQGANDRVRLVVNHAEEHVHERHDESRADGRDEHGQDEFGEQAGILRRILEGCEYRALTAGDLRRLDQDERQDGKRRADTCNQDGVAICNAARSGDVLRLSNPGGEVAADPIADGCHGHHQPLTEAEEIGAFLLVAVFHQEGRHRDACQALSQTRERIHQVKDRLCFPDRHGEHGQRQQDSGND